MERRKKYYSVSVPTYNDDGHMEEARISCIGCANAWGVLFEDLGKNYIRVGSIRKDIENAFEKSYKDLTDAGRRALELALIHANKLIEERGYRNYLDIISVHPFNS